MRKKETITTSEIGKMLGLADTVVRTHLCCFEKYRIPLIRPFTYTYNYRFLLSLRSFYKEKSESIGKNYRGYKDVVKKIDKVIDLWTKVNRTKKN